MTPATKLLDELGLSYQTVSYHHDPSTVSYGTEAAVALGPRTRFGVQDLLADVDGDLVVACVPVTGQLDLKALAKGAAGKKAVMATLAVN